MDAVDRALWSLSDRLKVRIIPRMDGRRYLERYFLFKTWRRTYFLHRFVNSDPTDEVHDHPWNSWAFILWGWYVEFEWVGGTEVKRVVKWFNRVQGRKFHRVELPLNWFDPGGPPRHVWTLFVHGPRFKPWGFLKRFTIEMGEQDMQFYSYTPVAEHDNEYRQAKWYEKDDCRRGRDIREDRALGI